MISTGKAPSRLKATDMLIVFALALILRAVYAHQLGQSYFFAPFKGGYDDYIFDNWAREILRGNWFGDREIYMYRMPLYVYLLAGVYYLFGHSYVAVYAIQAVIGALTCALVGRIGAAYFGRAAGVAAGLIVACYGPLLFYGGMLVGETVAIAITCAGFACLVGFERWRSLWALFAAGICIGIAMLARGNMLFLMPFIILWIAAREWRRGIVKALATAALFIVGALAAVSPILARNYICERDVVPITALGGLNMYIGNAYGADGRYHGGIARISTNAENMIRDSVLVAEKESGRPLKPSEVSNFWLKETIKSANEHKWGYLIPLVFKKVTLFWNSYELPDIWSYYFMREYIPVLKSPFLISFGVISALFCVGAYLSRRRWRELTLPYLFVFGYMVSLVAVFITSRYRVQVVPFLSIFAGYTLIEVYNILKNKDLRRLFVPAFVFIVSIVVFHIDVGRTSHETSFNSLAILLKREGRIEEAIETYHKALELAPRYPTPYYNLGILYRDQGRADLAIKNFKRALELNPDFKDARSRLDEMTGKY